MSMNVRKTLVLEESVLITKVPIPASVELATRAHSPGQSVETSMNVYRMAGSAITGVVSTPMAASIVCVTLASTLPAMGKTVKTWMSAAYGTCALMGCASMKMAVLSVFASLDSSWHRMGVTAKISTNVKHLESA